MHWRPLEADILHQALRMEFWGYTNQVRLRGLTENQGFLTCVVRYAQRQRDRQVLFVCSLSLSGFNRQV